MATFEKFDVLPDITNRAQLKITAASLMGEILEIQKKLHDQFEYSNDAGKILKVTVDFCITSLQKTIIELDKSAALENNSPEIEALIFQREKLFYYNILLAIEALKDIPPTALTATSDVMKFEINQVITGLNGLWRVSEILSESINGNIDETKEKKLHHLYDNLNMTIKNKELAISNSKNKQFLEGLRNTIAFMAYLAFNKIALFALDLGVDILKPRSIAFAKRSLQMLEKEKKEQRNAERKRPNKNQTEMLALNINRFTATRSKEITDKILELKSTVSPPPSNKKS